VSERSATHSAPESYNPYGIAVDATHVYWTDSIAGTVLRAPKGGGAVTTLASEQRTVAAVAVSATHVYFTIRGNGRAADGAVRRVPKGGGGIEEIAGQQLGPNAIVTDQHAVYWTSAGYAGALDGAVLRWLEQGGEPKALAVGLFEPRGLALDDNDVYVSSGDSILYVSKRGGPVASFIHGLKTPWALTTSDTHLSWSDPFAGAVGSAPLDDPSQASAITGLRTPVGVATCAGVVYASLIDAERVLLANKPIASIVSQPNALACDDSRVFVSSMSGRRVDAMGLAGEQPRAISNETARFRIRR
jgi:hypothetical protein